MNKQLNQWINNLYRHGAIDAAIRDDLTYRLNVQREDFAPIIAAMDYYIPYMTPTYQAKWAALKGGK